MLPNLTFIIAAYVGIRLITIIARQLPSFEATLAYRIGVSFLSVSALFVVVVCTLDTIGVGLRGYHSEDPTHGLVSP